jgi:hypothetical protein
MITGFAVVSGVVSRIVDPIPVSLDVIAAGVIFIAGLNIQQAYRSVKVDERIGTLDVKLDSISTGMQLLKDQINNNIDVANRCCKKRKYTRIR